MRRSLPSGRLSAKCRDMTGMVAGCPVALMDCSVFDSTIVGNRCNNGGGGAANSDLTQCEVFNNSATWTDRPHGFGGGTYSCTVTDSVLAGNYAGYGGAACNGYLENCVMTNNQATVYEGGATYGASTRNCLVARNTAKMYYAACKGTHYGTLPLVQGRRGFPPSPNPWHP